MVCHASESQGHPSVCIFTSGEVFTYRTTTMAYAVLLYLLFASFFHMIHYRYARKNTEYIEKQYQIIQAIKTGLFYK